MGINITISMMKIIYKHYPHIPITLHLNHNTTFKNYKKTIKTNFTSIIINTSHHTFKKNLKLTSKIIKITHNTKINIKTKLKHLIKIKNNISINKKNTILINPKKTKQFIKKSQINYLTPTIKTNHKTFKFKNKPKLNFKHLQKIKKLTNIPLILHKTNAIPNNIKKSYLNTKSNLKNSKNIPFKFLQKSIKKKINKINTNTNLKITFITKIRKITNKNKNQFNLKKFFSPTQLTLKNIIKKRIKLLNSTNKI